MADAKNASLSLEAQMKNVVSIGKTLNKNIEGLQGCLNMCGVEAEGLNTVLQGTQILVTLLKGSKGILGLISNFPNLIKQFKGARVATIAFNNALKANPVGIIVAALLTFISVIIAVGATIAKFISSNDKQAKAAQELAEKQEKVNAQYEKLEKNQETFLANLEKESEALKEQGEALEEVHKKRLEQMDARIVEIELIRAQVQELEGESKRYKELTQQLEELAAARQEIAAKQEEELAAYKESEEEKKRIAAEAARTHAEQTKKGDGRDPEKPAGDCRQ